MTSPLSLRRGLPLAAGLALLALSACSNPGAAVTGGSNTRTATLARGTLIASVTATGNIQAESETRLGFLQSGTVSTVTVKVGDVVKKGDVLARLDTTDFEIALAQSQASLAQAQAGLMNANAAYSRTVEGPRAIDIQAAEAAYAAALANYDKVAKGPQPNDYAAAQAALDNADAALRQAQSAYDRAFSRDPAGIASSPAAVQLEQATNNYRSAKAQLDKLKQGADSAQLSAAWQQVQNAKASLEKAKDPARAFDLDTAEAGRRQALAQIDAANAQVRQAQRRIEQAALTAPVAGVISLVNLRVGELAGATPTLAVVDDSALRIDVNVDEVDVARIKVGQEVNITLDSLPGVEIKGRVDRIAPTSTLVNGVVSYSVRVAVPRSEQPLKIGMTANAAIVLDKRDNAVLAPNWAIRRDRASGKSYLTVREGDKNREIEVQTGLRNDTFSEIVSGANAGLVVVAPVAPNVLGQ
ncbi:MAG: efflux RND transporter periplasmic adaptor subunit [Thermoflexales bacterium]|nr:efflux RND transporter periplasmic adaptor subunit [Thermoflexales bacterium]